MKYGILSVVFLTACFSAALAAAQTQVVVVPIGGKKPTGDAVATDVLEGKTFSNKDEIGVPGAMVNNGAMNFTPGTYDQAIPEGYHNGSGTVQGDTDLVSGNIKTGATIFGVSGSAIESSGTATPDQVLAGQTFSNVSGPATGTMPNVGAQNITPGTTNQVISQGYHNGSGSVAGDIGLVSGNIRSGVTLFGITGDSNVVNTASGDAAAHQILLGKKAWVDGSEITGAMPNVGTQNITPGTTVQSISWGYHTGSGSVAGDSDLVEGNIKYGTTIFGVAGTFMPPSAEPTVTSAGQVWMNRNLGASRVATSLTDAEAYGDLYQWGRWSDGHQLRTSPTTTSLSATDSPGHGSFILAPTTPSDWRSPQNANLWQGVSGVNNPCPAGFRLPTYTEWETEISSWGSNDTDGAFGSPLKLVPAGSRGKDGVVSSSGNYGRYWSSTAGGIYSVGMGFGSGSAVLAASDRAYGFSVRCLRD